MQLTKRRKPGRKKNLIKYFGSKKRVFKNGRKRRQAFMQVVLAAKAAVPIFKDERS